MYRTGKTDGRALKSQASGNSTAVQGFIAGSGNKVHGVCSVYATQLKELPGNATPLTICCEIDWYVALMHSLVINATY